MRASGHTQSSLAKACGLTRGAVSQWVNGDVGTIKGENLIRAAQALQVTPEWLVYGPSRKRATYQVEQNLAQYQYQSKGSADAGKSPPLRSKTRRLIQNILDLEVAGQLQTEHLTTLQNMVNLMARTAPRSKR